MATAIVQAMLIAALLVLVYVFIVQPSWRAHNRAVVRVRKWEANRDRIARDEYVARKALHERIHGRD